MSAESVRLAQEIGALLAGRDIVAMLGDPAELARARTALARLVEPGFEVAMVGPDYLPETLEDEPAADPRGSRSRNGAARLESPSLPRSTKVGRRG